MPDSVKKLQKQKPHLFQPGQSGNPAGRKPGSRNRATMAAQALLDGEAEELTRLAIERAKDGDMAALKLCLERILPPTKERPLPAFELPEAATASDLPKLTAALMQAAASGELLPGEAASLAALVASHSKAVELAELESRLAALEASLAAQGAR